MLPEEVGKIAVSVALVLRADRMVHAEMFDLGVKRPEAERIVARRVGVPPTAIDNLRRGRLKYAERIRDKINAAFAAFLERQIVRLETELAVARAEYRECDFGAADVAIEQTKAALGTAKH